MTSSSAPSTQPSSSSSSREDIRVQALHSYDILDTEPEPAFDHITKLAAHLFEAPIALVNLVDDGRHWIKSSVGIENLTSEGSETELEIPFCSYAIQTEGPLVVEHAATDERFSETELVAEQGIQFYAGAPLRTPSEYRIGTLCVLDTQSRSPTDTLTSQLETLAALVMDELNFRATRSALKERNRQVSALSSALTSAEERERVRISAVLHDDLQQILSAAQMNLERVEENVSSESAVPGLDKTYELLKQAIETTRTLSSELNPPIGRQSLRDTFEWMAIHMRKAYGLSIDLEVDEPELPVSEDLCALFFRTTRELLFNTVKHAGVDRAEVTLTETGDGLRVVVEDEGAGFDPSSLEEEEHKEGLGLFSVRNRLNMIGGRLAVDAAPGEGTRVTLGVPVRKSEEVLVAAHANPELLDLP